ncbi:unnamed protein product, partial [Meganyctiphanes norvegica]
MAESDDELDYMSDAFLAQCSGRNDDVRPGLMHSHATKRKAQMEKKKVELDAIQKAKKRPFKEVEKERLNEGLHKALESNNKGFAMLTKMGYKPGTSLGKEGKGIIEPVKVDLKIDRVGLGWQQMITDHRRKREENRLKRMKKHAEACDPDEYSVKMRTFAVYLHKMIHCGHNNTLICSKLEISVSVCCAPGWPMIYVTSEPWAGRNVEAIHRCYADILGVYKPHDQLRILTSYLRDTYFYCIWCGTAYNNTEDLNSNCPGKTREDHDEF